jgi:SAM-dependent methyltransferase
MNMVEKDHETITQAVKRFYDLRPYPPPVDDLEDYRLRWQDRDRRRADFYLHFPGSTYREDMPVLVAGCGTSQAARYAMRYPYARVIGIDISKTSIRHTQALKERYRLENLELCQLPLEQASSLGMSFERIICSGVLHHLPDPERGLILLREVLEPRGTLQMMVYAAYGRTGIGMMQEYARLLGVGDTDDEITDFANTLMALPLDHPMAALLGGSPDFRSKAGLADALLNPHDRSFTVPQLFRMISRSGCKFGRWLRQAPYLPQCGAFRKTPHARRLLDLPEQDRYAAMELLRGNMLRHSLVLYRDDGAGDEWGSFDAKDWLLSIPLRLPDTVCVTEDLPEGVAGVLINRNHTDRDIYLTVNSFEIELYRSIDGQRSIAEILKGTPVDRKQGSRFFINLWFYDQVVFNRTKQAYN